MLLTRKNPTATAGPPRLAPVSVLPKTIDRRAFLKRSGLGLGAGALATKLPFSAIGEASAEQPALSGNLEVKRTICSHCSVGCAIDAVVENGVWVRQEPVFDSPINLGAHCTKGASVRDLGSFRIRSLLLLRWRISRRSPTSAASCTRKSTMRCAA